MVEKKIFYKRSRSGGVVKIVREQYLRDDIACGIDACHVCVENEGLLAIRDCGSRSSLISEPHLVVVDTNIVLHQMDVLEDPAFRNVVIAQTVLDEIRQRSPPSYKKIKAAMDVPEKRFYFFHNEFHKDTYVKSQPCETSNDRNDRAIRTMTAWYRQHLKNLGLNLDVVMLSDDKYNVAKAKAEGITSYSLVDYVSGMKNHLHLLDKIAANVASDRLRDRKSKILFPEHKSLFELKAGVKAGIYKQGTFQVTRSNYLEAFVFLNDEETDQIFIQGLMNCNRAVHGDRVVVELLPKEEWTCPASLLKVSELDDDQGDELDRREDESLKTAKSSRCDVLPSGRVIGILKRNWRPYCGVLDISPVEASTRHLFIPSEKRVPRIRIETHQASLLNGHLIMVNIDAWPRDSRYPVGHFIKILGLLGDKATENEVLLLEHDVPHGTFGQSVLKCLPTMPWEVSQADLKEREDLRDLVICSVDPPGCTDIDDALHCRKLANGNFEVGVHIADVTHFVLPDTALDQEAAERGTTVYLIDQRIDMLPDLLSSDLCSLRQHEDRLAFSVIWEMNPDAEIVATRYTKSIIRSKGSLTYYDAQMFIDDRMRHDNVAESLRYLNMLAKKLKQRRTESGALTLASLEIRFNIDTETHDPIAVQSKEALETNSLVEEFMLLANVSVAEKICDAFPQTAVLRRHPTPATSNFQSVIKAAAARGFNIDVQSNKALADSLSKAVIHDNPFFNTMLRMLVTRCMTQAVYFCSGTISRDQYHHYGLAAPIYTHFTSPIRRYADILVHRLLFAAINPTHIYPDLLDTKKLEEICRVMNYRHRMAQYASRASVLLNTHIFFKTRSEDLDGYVIFVRRNAFQVLIPKYGFESAVMLKGKEHLFRYDSENQTLHAGDVVLHIFDQITVQLSLDTSDVQHHKLRLQLVKPKIPDFSVEPLMDIPVFEVPAVNASS